MYSKCKKEPGQDIVQTNGKEKQDDAKESRIPQIIHGTAVDSEEKHSKKSPKRKFITTKQRRQYYETRSKKR